MIVCKAAIIGQAADVCEHVAKRDLRCDRMLRQPAVKGVVQIEAAGGDQAEQGGRLDRLGETVKQDPAIALNGGAKPSRVTTSVSAILPPSTATIAPLVPLSADWLS